MFGAICGHASGSFNVRPSGVEDEQRLFAIRQSEELQLLAQLAKVIKKMAERPWPFRPMCPGALEGGGRAACSPAPGGVCQYFTRMLAP